MRLLLRMLISSVAVYFTAWLLPEVSIKSYGSAVIVAIVLGILNAILKPILKFISIPITIVTLGLFLLVINAFIILIASYLANSFQVNGFWWALLFSLIISIVGGILENLMKVKRKQ